MHTYQASVRAQVQGRSQVIKTEVRALNAQDARWLLWAQWGFHSIQSGPTQSKPQLAFETGKVYGVFTWLDASLCEPHRGLAFVASCACRHEQLAINLTRPQFIYLLG
jgi:hypothetical protein